MTDSDIPNRFTAKTDFGSFNVKISNRDFITIGTKYACVQVSYDSISNTATLSWLGTELGGCEINGKEIRGKDTVSMADLAFTILKQLYPNVNPFVSLIDTSHFRCDLPDGTPISISNMIYNLLLTGKTYYQNRFNATLKYENSKPAYEKFVANRLNPQFFDKSYNFNNNDLNELLQPILQSSANWAEFFEKLYNEFGRQSCVIMHSWYKNVSGYLAQEPIHSEWIIDISSRSNINYTITSRNNSRNYTRKTFVYNPYEFSGGNYIPSLLSYKLIRSKKNNTRKIIQTL